MYIVKIVYICVNILYIVFIVHYIGLIVYVAPQVRRLRKHVKICTSTVACVGHYSSKKVLPVSCSTTRVEPYRSNTITPRDRVPSLFELE